VCRTILQSSKITPSREVSWTSLAVSEPGHSTDFPHPRCWCLNTRLSGKMNFLSIFLPFSPCFLSPFQTLRSFSLSFFCLSLSTLVFDVLTSSSVELVYAVYFSPFVGGLQERDSALGLHVVRPNVTLHHAVLGRVEAVDSHPARPLTPPWNQHGLSRPFVSVLLQEKPLSCGPFYPFSCLAPGMTRCRYTRSPVSIYGLMKSSPH